MRRARGNSDVNSDETGQDVEKKLAFLLYLNRSGSTFLARQLDSLVDVSVSIEADFVDGIYKRGYRIRTAEDVSEYLDAASRDSKFSSWPIDRSRLERRLAAGPFPVPFVRFLKTAIEESVSASGVRVLVFKHGPYWSVIRRLHREAPDALFLFIARDPRGIFASQKRSIDIRTKRPMSERAAISALMYRAAVRCVLDSRSASRLLVLRYEDVIADLDEELSRICSFLDIHCERTPQDEYASRIPEEQRHLHGNVEAPPLAGRMDAWRTELSRRDLLTLESIAGSAMQRLGYSVSGERPRSLREWAFLVWDVGTGCARYFAGRCKYWLLVKPW